MMPLEEKDPEPPRTVMPIGPGDSLVLAVRLLADRQREPAGLRADSPVSLVVPERFVPALCAEVDRFLGQADGTAGPEQAEAYLAGYGVRVLWIGRAGAISLDETGLTVL
jgi:hypothetical protein